MNSIIREQELEQKLNITNDELNNFIDRVKYKDKRLKLKEVRGYLNQFGKNSIQRKAFFLINNLFYVSSYEIQSFFRSIQKQVLILKKLY